MKQISPQFNHIKVQEKMKKDRNIQIQCSKSVSLYLNWGKQTTIIQIQQYIGASKMDSQEQSFDDRKQQKSERKSSNNQQLSISDQVQDRQLEEDCMAKRGLILNEQSSESDQYIQCLRCNTSIETKLFQQHWKEHIKKRRKHKNNESRKKNKFLSWTSCRRKQNLNRNANTKKDVECNEMQEKGVDQKSQGQLSQQDINNQDKQISMCKDEPPKKRSIRKLKRLERNIRGKNGKFVKQMVKVQVSGQGQIDKKIRKRGRPRKNVVISIDSESDPKCNQVRKTRQKNRIRSQNINSLNSKNIMVEQNRQEVNRAPYKLSRVQLLQQLALRNKTYIMALQNHLLQVRKDLNETKQKLEGILNENNQLKQRIMQQQKMMKETQQIYNQEIKKHRQAEVDKQNLMQDPQFLNNKVDQIKLKIYQSTISLIKIEEGWTHSNQSSRNKEISPDNIEKMGDICIKNKQSDKQRTSEEKLQGKKSDQDKLRHKQRNKWETGLSYFRKLKLQQSQSD